LAPLGNFAGILDGQGHAIDHLASSSGMFNSISASATVRNLNVTNVSVNATADSVSIGGLAGENHGTITSVSVSGAVGGGTHTGIVAGGLVGSSQGTIVQSISAANVTVGATGAGGVNIAGGLVGSNFGTISQSSASGSITSGNNTWAGGLVGENT